MSEEINVDEFFQRRVRIYNQFRWVSISLIILGFIILLIGTLLDWNVWIYTWIGGAILLFALILPFVVRRILRVRDPEMIKYLVLENVNKIGK